MKRSFYLVQTLAAALVLNAPGATFAKFGEAPELSRLVQQGLLPPVEQRLPSEPLVVKVYEEIGRYGGIWRRLMSGPSDLHAFNRINYEALLRYPPDLRDGIQPNIVEHWVFNDDLTAITLHIRQGIRWSDGAPFSADDIVFCWERILNNPRITTTVPGIWRPGGDPMKMVQVDRYTLRLEFSAPYPLVLDYLAFRGSQWPNAVERQGLFAPKHYLSPSLERIRMVNGVTEPDPDYETFERLADDWNPARPVLTPWQISFWDAGSRLLAVRNPYYWKVDPAGNQLPYIDEVQHEISYNRELLKFRAVTGEIDMQLRGFMSRDWFLLQGFRRKGDYRTVAYRNMGSGSVGVCLNLEYSNAADPERGSALRRYFQMPEFRQALSLATDRELIRDVIFKNRLDHSTFDFPEESGLQVGDPELDRWLRYDPEQASRMLDEIGLSRRDGNGFRMMQTENGDWVPLSIIIEVNPSMSPIGPLEMVCAQWARAGVRATIRPQDRTLNDLRVFRAGVHMATMESDWGSHPLLNASMKFGVAPGSWCHFYALWHRTRHLEQPAGVEPPAVVQRLHELYEKMLVTNDPSALRRYAEEVARINGEHVFFIPVIGRNQCIGIVRNDMRNVPETGSGSLVTWSPSHLNPATFFFKREAN